MKVWCCLRKLYEPLVGGGYWPAMCLLEGWLEQIGCVETHHPPIILVYTSMLRLRLFPLQSEILHIWEEEHFNIMIPICSEFSSTCSIPCLITAAVRCPIRHASLPAKQMKYKYMKPNAKAMKPSLSQHYRLWIDFILLLLLSKLPSFQ